MDASRIRSILFVPGDSPRKLAKAAGTEADALIVDWEDAVGDANKGFAREFTRAAMPGLRSREAVILIRINASAPALVDLDCRAVSELRPDGIVIPGCESASQVRDLTARVPGGTAAFPLIESPRGLLNAAEIAAASDKVRAVMFGAEDYSAEARIMRSEGEPELACARSCVVNAARAAGCEAFDSPSMQFADLDAVRCSADRARRMGFSGQAAIHPGQVAIVNEVFTPSDGELAAAEDVLKRYRQHGGGAYAVEGVVEDNPAVKQAIAVLSRRR